ncbi:Ribonucleotide reductase of class III (anaerobic), activating protein [hydrothermal vent metagenome]|uniref:Ribonucleotide reductase of class III (Anaerobic), activating protein n=1 Tax=hydrothermal vent metagenome TaxID=652676 RepID=A0A3B0YRC0_9ZZZZ
MDLNLNIAAIVNSTQAEGPGRRFTLWVQGCPLTCPNCCNPELLSFKPQRWRSVDDIFKLIAVQKAIEGVTFLGGEPFSQASALAALANKVRAHNLSVMVFTGYTKKFIDKEQNQDWNALLAQTDLLIDGPYVEKLHTSQRHWIGSSNQKVHFLTDRYQYLQAQKNSWDSGKNSIELRLSGNTMTLNGFPDAKVDQWLNTLKNKS